jgi:hypothetical protein
MLDTLQELIVWPICVSFPMTFASCQVAPYRSLQGTHGRSVEGCFTAGGREVGRVTSACQLPAAAEEGHALAYLDFSGLANGADGGSEAFLIGGARARLERPGRGPPPPYPAFLSPLVQGTNPSSCYQLGFLPCPAYVHCVCTYVRACMCVCWVGGVGAVCVCVYMGEYGVGYFMCFSCVLKQRYRGDGAREKPTPVLLHRVSKLHRVP